VLLFNESNIFLELPNINPKDKAAQSFIDLAKEIIEKKA